MNAVKGFTEFIIRVLFPPRCFSCNQVIETDSYYSVCSTCFTSIPFVKGRACKLCGKSLGKSEIICGSCKEIRDITISFDEVICPCEYSGIIKKAVRNLKYHNKKKLGRFLALLIEEKLRVNSDLKSMDMVTCVPIHKEKLRYRGYNQSALIAEELGRKLDIPFNASILYKTRETESQSRLTRQERLENVRDCYELTSPDFVRDKNILLIDDVITTGSTLNECSRVLRKSGAAKIMVAVAATGKSTQ